MSQETIVSVAQQVAEGKLPSNEQIKSQLDPIVDHLSNAEQKSVGLPKAEAFHQTAELVKAVEKTIETKNSDEKLQKLAAAAAKVAQRTSPANVETSQNVWNETREFVADLKDLATNLVMSKQFRESLVDFFGILKDITQEEADKVSPVDKAKEGFVEGKPLEAAQDIINQASDIATNLSDEVTEEQKQKLRDNLKKFLTQLKNEADTTHAFRKFLRLVSTIQKEVSIRVTASQIDKDVREVEELAVDLVDSFLHGKSIHQLFERIKAFVEQLQNDEDLQKLLHNSRELIESALNNPELIDSDKFYDDANKLYEKAKKTAKKYRKDQTIDKLIDEAQAILKTFQNDPQITELQYRASKVVDSVTYTDIRGNTHVDFDIIASMRKELVPFLIERIDKIPIPGFRLQNEDFEYLEIKDLSCKLGDVLPDKIHIRAMNDTDLTLKNFEAPVQSESYITFYMEGVRPQFEDFHFTFKKKGLVKLEDEGRATLKLTGDGVKVYMKFDLNVDQNNRTILGKHKAEIKTDGIDLDIVEADHKILLNLVSSLFTPAIRKGIEAAIQQRFEQMGTEWAAYINKRILSALPTLAEIGQSVTTAALPPLQVLGETTTKVTQSST